VQIGEECSEVQRGAGRRSCSGAEVQMTRCRCAGAGDVEMQRRSCCRGAREIGVCRDAEVKVQRCRSAGAEVHRGVEVQRYRGAEVQV
jgi:hypothetical protein